MRDLIHQKNPSLLIAMLCLLIPVIAAHANDQPLGLFGSNESLYESSEWVDSVYKTLSLDEKIGQLFMVAAYSNKGKAHKQNITKLVKQYHIGGLIFFQGSPKKQAKLTNHYQQQADIPLLIAMDAEWGLSMRLDSTIAFPKQMTLGAHPNDSMVYNLGANIANQCKKLGVHINFAPVVDINNNPKNPVIHMRSFGEKKKNVANKGKAYLKGMQENGLIGVAKHFPGHGDTDQDSHLNLPEIPYDKTRLDTLELYPFRKMLESKTGGVMSAHLSVPAYEEQSNLPSSLSSNVVNDLLREKMGYQGLVFTDALNMKGVTKHFQPGEIEKKALKAGNDILLFPKNIPAAVKAIKKGLKSGDIDKKQFNKSVRRVLKAKHWSDLNSYEPVEVDSIKEKLKPKRNEALKQQLIEDAMTVVSNKNSILPLKKLSLKDCAVLTVGTEKETPFEKQIKKYASVKTFSLPKDASKMDFAVLRQKLRKFDQIIISTHNLSEYDLSTFGLSESIITYTNQIAEQTKNILVNFGSPYALKLFSHNEGILQAYEDGASFQKIAAQGIFGAFTINGELPVSIKKHYHAGEGIKTGSINRLQYTLPERVGISSDSLNKGIDSLAKRAIEKKATPGCQVLVAKEGKVVYNKAFGYHTYDRERRVKTTDIYDIASITKITATMLPIMRLYDIGRISLKDSLGQYLAMDIDSMKADLTLKEILTHQAGLEAWIPFYKYTLTEEGFCDSNYCYEPNSFFRIKVANNLYLQANYTDSIWRMINESKVEGRGNYRYSDLGFFYMKKLVEKLIQVPFKDYLDKNFYKPLGLTKTVFLPREEFSLKNIVPTEDEDNFRNQLIHGYVHDPAAAMLGGIAGHAGLFSNANDLAKLMQMLLNGGKYGDKRYFSWPTVQQFTSQQYEDNRKGLGFDKPETDPDKLSPASDLASAKTFGHTGFTGTCVWADPKHDLVYVFLSNRVHPNRENRKLISMDFRTNIQREIYKSFLSDEVIERRLEAR